MKTTKKNVVLNACNNSVAIPKDVANRHFLKAATKSKDSGGNDYAETFLQIMDRVHAYSRGTYSLGDAHKLAKPFDMPPEQVTQLFGQYVKTFAALGKVEVLPSVYDNEDLIVIIS